MDTARYLKRIGFTGLVHADGETLIRLHKSHVYQVPFENLDIHYGRLFNLAIDSVYKKVVEDCRGGFCYELNLVFSCVLNALGFSSRVISSRIFTDTGVLGPEFDHMSVYVKTDSEYLVDVGFGDLFVVPLEIRAGIQYDGKNFFTIDKYDNANYLLSMSADGIDFQKKYIFSLDQVSVDSFNAICYDKQTNPDSYFVKNTICTKPTEAGRLTIFNDKVIERIANQKTESLITTEAQLKGCLRDRFGIVIKYKDTNSTIEH